MADALQRVRMGGNMRRKEMVSVKIVPKELTCPTCSRLCVEPKLLACLHTVCQTCIRKLRITQKGVYSFKCPTCDHLTKATDYADFSGINLPTNVYMLGLLEIYANRKTDTSHCLVCSSKNDKMPAAFKCLDCGDTLCRVCSRGHNSSSSTSHHAVVSLDKLRTGNYDMAVLRRQSVACTKHKESYRFYCNTCASLICELCALGEHKLHRHTTLDKALEEKTETLQKILPREHSVMAITNRIAELTREEERFKSRIWKDTTELIEVVSRARKGILGAAKMIYDRERESLEKHLSAFSRETMAMYSKVNKVGGNEFLALSESLESALRKSKDTMPSEITLPTLKKLHAQVNGFHPGSKIITLLNVTEGVNNHVYGSVIEGKGTFEVDKDSEAAIKADEDSREVINSKETMLPTKLEKDNVTVPKPDKDSETSKPDKENGATSNQDRGKYEATKPDKDRKTTELNKNTKGAPEQEKGTSKAAELQKMSKAVPKPGEESQGTSDQAKDDKRTNKLDDNAAASMVDKDDKRASVQGKNIQETSALVNGSIGTSSMNKDNKGTTLILSGDGKATNEHDKGSKGETAKQNLNEVVTGKRGAETSVKPSKNMSGPEISKDSADIIAVQDKQTVETGPKAQAKGSNAIQTDQVKTKQPSAEAAKKEDKRASESIVGERSLTRENGGGDLLETASKETKAPDNGKPNEKKAARKHIQDIDPLKTPVFEMPFKGPKYKTQFTIKLSSDQRPPNISCLEAASDGSMVVLDDNNYKVMFFDNTFRYNTFILKPPDQFIAKVVAQPNGYAAVNNNALMFFQRDLVMCSAIFLEKNLNPVQRLSPVLCKYNDALMVGNLPGNVMRFYDKVGMVRGSWVSRVRGPITSLRHISGDRFVMCSWAFNGAVFIESQRDGIILSICGEFTGQRNDAWHPWDACVTPMGSVIVSDCLRDEIAVFNKRGQFISKIKTGNHGLQEPRCLLVDGKNRLLVSCRGGNVAEFVLCDV